MAETYMTSQVIVRRRLVDQTKYGVQKVQTVSKLFILYYSPLTTIAIAIPSIRPFVSASVTLVTGQA